LGEFSLSKVWNLLEQKVFSLPSTASLFNPYNDVDPAFDLPDADLIRRDNLRNYLRSFSMAPRIVLIGEAPGPWGCRFSGVPFTSEAQLCAGILPFRGCQSSNRDRPCSERSATIFWNTLRRHHPRFFQWNCIPLQPHRRGEPLSIRSPLLREIEHYGDVLLVLLSLLQPACVIAVGRKAHIALARIGVEAVYVRHPSHGGAKVFRVGVERLRL
jgi:hypothetical protein